MNLSEERSLLSYHKENASKANVTFYREREAEVTLAIRDAANKLGKTRDGTSEYSEAWRAFHSLEEIQNQWLDLILSVEPLPYDEKWDE